MEATLRKMALNFGWPRTFLPVKLDSKTKLENHQKILITGITGQDGIYMTCYLLFHMQESMTFSIHGLVRKNSIGLKILLQIKHVLKTAKSNFSTHYLANCDVNLHFGDVTDYFCMHNIIKTTKPDMIFNFAAQSQVAHSFSMPQATLDTNTKSVWNICQSLVDLGFQKKCKVFQASTSEMFGST